MKTTAYSFGALICAGTLLAAAPAHAIDPQNPFYASLSGDVTWLDHSDAGGGGQGAVGIMFWPHDLGDFRAEAEFGYHSVPGSNGAGSSQYYTYMGNLYYDLNIFHGGLGSWQVTPYVGGGLGDATLHLGENDGAGRYSISQDAFAYQVMAGLTFSSPNFMPNTDWSLGYRYVGSDSVSGSDNVGISNSDRLHSNNIELAARWHF